MLNPAISHKNKKSGQRCENPSPNTYSITQAKRLVNSKIYIMTKFYAINKNYLVTLFNLHIANVKNVCYNIDTKEREVHSNEKVKNSLLRKQKRSLG